MSLPNVLYVNQSLAIGGIETMIRDFALRLRGMGFHPSVAVFGEAGAIGEQLVSQGVAVDLLHKREGIDWLLVGRLRRVIREREIDIVHSNNYAPWFYSVLAVLGTRAVVVHTEHSKVRGAKRRHLVERLLASHSAAVVAVSAEVRRMMTEGVGIDGRLVRVIENGVDTDRFVISDYQRQLWRSRMNIESTALVLGIVARLVPVKAHEILLSGFAQFKADHGNARLVIVGDGPCRPQLEAQCHELGLSDSVLFLGELVDPSGLLSALDIYVLSSRSEGMNLTLLEAMSVGLPVVATAVGGNMEVVQDNVSGFLVAPEDASAIAEALARMALDSERMRQLGLAGRTRVCERFSQAGTLRAYVDLYKQLV